MDFSPVIFWDVDATNIDWQTRARFVIGRVVRLGGVDDWRKIKQLYGLDRIRSEMVKERDLDDRSLSFLSCVLGVPKDDFKCYTRNRLHQTHSIF
jgi:hypothetical protein